MTWRISPLFPGRFDWRLSLKKVRIRTLTNVVQGSRLHADCARKRE
jgi:hypothetical protein